MHSFPKFSSKRNLEMEAAMKGSVQICRGFTVRQWGKLKVLMEKDNDAAWKCAITVFERRIRERYLACIEALIAADSRADVDVPDDAPGDCSTLPNDGPTGATVPGFAIMALSCLLVETLHSFRVESGSNEQRFREFLKLNAFGEAFAQPGMAEKFLKGVRNKLLHQAKTEQWIIRREKNNGMIVERRDGRYIVYRNCFFKAVSEEFARYLEDLRKPGQTELRALFKKKMNDIVKES